MKTRIALLLLLPCSIILCGCPYESAVPLERPSVKVDPLLPGQWRETADTSEIYAISIRDSFSYNVDVRKSNKSEVDHYVAYKSHVKNATFLNVQEVKKEGASAKYFFFKMTMEGKDKIILLTVTENIREQFMSSADLRRFFADNMKNSYFFEKGQSVLVRQ